MNYLNWWESRQRGQMMIRSCRLGTGRNSEMIHRSRLAAQLLMKGLLLIIHRWCRRGRNWRRSWTRRGPLILLMNGGRWRGRCRRSEIRIVGHIAALHPLLFIYPDVGGWLLLDDEKKRAERTNQIDERRRRRVWAASSSRSFDDWSRETRASSLIKSHLLSTPG